MPTNPEANARELADRFWDDLLELDPIIGTEVGDERFDDRLPDPSADGRARREDVHRDALRALERVDRAELDMVMRTTLDVMEAIARRELASLEHRFDRFWAVTHLWGPGQLLADIGSLQRADTSERMDKYLARLRAVPSFMDVVIELVDEAGRSPQRSPTLVVERSIGQVERLLDAPLQDSPSLTPVPEEATADRDRVVQVLAEEVFPAYRRYLDALKRYRPLATDSIGLHALPNGGDMYAATILGWTTLPLDAKTVHETGLSDLERIQEERRQIARSLGHRTAEQALAAYEESGRNVAASPEEMIRLAEAQVQRGWGAASGYFGRLPRANCEVKPVEEFRQADVPFAYYLAPSADNSRPGIYYVNTSNLPERPLHHLATTTYHEANPGHHFQISIEQELSDRPSLRRFGGILAGSAFTEGWGLYSERLAEEMGLFEDEFERLGMLEAQGMRAARLVVDTGIHAFGWDRDRAVTTMEEAGVPRLDAEIEVDRYITLPGQALSYKIGQIEIERWRTAAADRDGSSFSLAGFNDHLLSLGSLPLSALERELRDGSAA